MQVFERLFDDPMYFWPFVPGASVSDRCDAAKRFGLYVMLIGGAVTWSVRAVVLGLIIIVLSHMFFCFDARFAKKTADDGNPHANYTVGRDFGPSRGRSRAPSRATRTNRSSRRPTSRT
eukprot:jgi/Mesvir1/10001/Mv05793-RA.1